MESRDQVTRSRRVLISNFRDGFFPTEWAGIKEMFETLKRGPAPDLVLTHYRDDRHQDHRVLSDLAWNTFRDHLVLEWGIGGHECSFRCRYERNLGRPQRPCENR